MKKILIAVSIILIPCFLYAGFKRDGVDNLTTTSGKVDGINVGKVDGQEVTAGGGSGHSKSDPNLKGLWYFENNLTDETSNNSDLTADGTVSYESSSPDPKQGTYSILLESTNDECVYCGASCTESNFEVTGPFSFGGWFYPANDTDHLVAGGKHGTSGDYGWKVNFRGDSGDSIGFYVSSNGTAWTGNYTQSDVFDAGNWYHVVCVYDGSYLRIYINASEVDDAVWPISYSSGINVSSTDFTIGGCSYDAGYEWDGNMDEIFFFDDALTAEEISNIYTNGFS